VSYSGLSPGYLWSSCPTLSSGLFVEIVFYTSINTG